MHPQDQIGSTNVLVELITVILKNLVVSLVKLEDIVKILALSNLFSVQQAIIVHHMKV
jgi:hypothetical protein